jgi:hypothetical protein
MSKIAARCVALGLCWLVFIPQPASSDFLSDTFGSNPSHTWRKSETLSLAVMAEATATPTPAATPATEIGSLLPTVTPTAPALAPDPTPVIEAVAAVQSVYFAVASTSSSAGSCWVANPPDALALDPFYSKYCSAGGIPIVASAAVPDQALQRAWAIVTQMLDGLSQAEEIRASITRLAVRIGIIGAGQLTTDMPEHRDLYTLFPGIDWNNRARGVGATPQIPLLSIAEENLLCYPEDRWIGQNILVHEFAHAIKNLGLDVVNPGFHAELQDIYRRGLDAGLWAGTYVGSSIEEYWAEGVRIYFQVAPPAGVPGGQPYPANTRAELQVYDPELYGIIERIFGPRDGIPLCPQTVLIRILQFDQPPRRAQADVHLVDPAVDRHGERVVAQDDRPHHA